MASRPYSLSAFSNNVYAYRQGEQNDEPLTTSSPYVEYAAARKYSTKYWSGLISPVRPIVALASQASIRVKAERLQIYDKCGGERSLEAGGILPKAIVFRSYGGMLTVPALKFCRDHDIAVTVLDEFSELLSVITPPGKISAALVRAQCRAEHVRVAREILIAKIKHSNASPSFAHPAQQRDAKCLPDKDAKTFIAALKQGSAVAELIQVEALAARIYWINRACALRVRPHRSLPSVWRIYNGRLSRIGTRSPRHADHPVNSMLNLAYHSAAGRLGAALAAYGACLALGYLHNDKQGRYSLVYDALELLRPIVDDLVFRFVARNTFDRSDFLKLSTGDHVGYVRLAPALAAHLLQECAPPQAEIDKAAKFMIDLLSGL